MSLLSAELEAFVAIVKTSTVHGAAKEIGLTQTGITQRIEGSRGRVELSLHQIKKRHETHRGR